MVRTQLRSKGPFIAEQSTLGELDSRSYSLITFGSLVVTFVAPEVVKRVMTPLQDHTMKERTLPQNSGKESNTRLNLQFDMIRGLSVLVAGDWMGH